MIDILKIKDPLLILAWALYDLANQLFAVNIVSLCFVRCIVIVKGIPEFFYGLSSGISTFLVAVISSVWGAISDFSQRTVYLTLIAIVFTLFLGITQNVSLALIFFAIANFACQSAVIFYNALMTKIIKSDNLIF